MKILWISLAPIGPASKILGKPYTGSSGTWIQTEYENISKNGNIQLGFLTSDSSLSNGRVIHKKDITGEAFSIGYKSFTSFGRPLTEKVSNAIKDCIAKYSPDIIHIWGTESNFTAGAALLTGGIPTVIFIQGLVGMHYRYLNSSYYPEITQSSKFFEIIKDRLKRYYFKKHVKYEQQAISEVKNIITDNNFTESYINSFCMNGEFYYHFLSPNDVFFKSKWKYEEINPYTIFTTFSAPDLKGLSKLLLAVSWLKNKYPDICLLVPGPFSINENGNLNPKQPTTYLRWCHDFILKHQLQSHVKFLGRLSPEEMANKLAHAHVFVSSSGMEVHSSSLREAMAVGTPTISAVCGSVIEYLKDEDNGLLYRFEEPEVLADNIDRLFSDLDFAKSISSKGRETISNLSRYSDINNLPLLQIYENLIC